MKKNSESLNFIDFITQRDLCARSIDDKLLERDYTTCMNDKNKSYRGNENLKEYGSKGYHHADGASMITLDIAQFGI